MDEARTRGIVVAMTGASGAAYGLRLMRRLGGLGARLHVLVSDAARLVLREEAGLILPEEPGTAAETLTRHLRLEEGRIACHALDDWFSPAASGSAGIRRMAVAPCSMGTLARIATGASDNLIERAADVMLKEGGRLILMPRETPLSAIHLEHMLKLARLGARIVPAMPGFYHRPESLDDLVDFMVDRMMMQLGLADGSEKRWGA